MTTEIGVDISADVSGLDQGFSQGEKLTQGFSSSVQKSSVEIASSAQKMADSLGMSSKQTAFALRMIPAQMTDIVTQLAGGQNPLLVLVQQGGQLKDMFGGIGPAIRAMGGYVAGLVNPFSLAAVAAGALTYAFIEGRSESSAYEKSLILSGNAARTSAGQLQEMAYRVASTTGATHGAAAETLNALAGTGKVSASVLEQATRAALELERAGGPAVESTIKTFSALGADPVNAVLKLNDQFHFLTGSIYEQIKALSDQGREAEAAALAQTSYADAIERRIPSLVDNLGTLEKAWRGIKDGAKTAWDAMAGIGREGSLDAQLERIDKEIAARKQKPSGEYHLWDVDKFGQQSGESVQKLEEQRRIIVSMQSARVRMAGEAQRQAEINAADLFIAKKKEESLSKQEKLEREILAIRNNAKLAGTPSSVVDDLIKKATDKYTDKKKAPTDELGPLMNRLAGLDANYSKELDTLYGAYEKGKLGIDEYRTAVEQLIMKQPFAVKAAQDEKRALDEQLKVFDATTRAEEHAGKAMTDFTVKTSDRVEAIQRQIELLGKTPDQAAQINAFADIERQANALLLKLQELRASVAVKGGDTTAIDKLISDLPVLAELAKGKAADALDNLREAQDRLNASWEYGADEALRKYLDEVGNVAAKSEQLVTGSFKKMDDALTDWAMTGKANSKDLFDSIIRDLIRMQMQANITGPLAGMMKNAGGIGGFFSSLFDGGSDYSTNVANMQQEASNELALLASAKGNVFSGGTGLHQYVNTVQTSPKVFAFAKGGIFAEEDPEAVMPLARDGQGRLGVRSQGGAPVFNLNIIGASSQPKTEAKQNSSGGMDINVIFEQAEGYMNKRIAQGVGLAPLLEHQYGLNRAAGLW